MRSRKRHRRWPAVVNVVAFLIAIVAGVVTFFHRGDGVDPEAFAAPGKRALVTDGGGEAPDAKAASAAAGDASVAPAVGAAGGAKPEAEGDGGPPQAIDLAVAPDGGVPFHPTGTKYRSPFAKPNAGAPIEVKVATLLNSVDDYDVKTGTFTADFFLSLTSLTAMPPLNLQFPNGKVENKEVIADKPTFKLFRLSGTFKSPADLRKYPFDSQELKILVEDDALGIDQLRFVVDAERQQLARGFRAVGWQVSYVEGRVLSQSYPDRFEGDDLFYGRYTFVLGIERFATSAAFQVFVPAFVIVLISILGMWVPPGEMEVRSNSGAPMLAGAVLFHFALMQALPATSYLTRADKLMSGVYIALALGMLSTWVMFLVKEENMDKVFRIARVVVPVLSGAVMLLACFA